MTGPSVDRLPGAGPLVVGYVVPKRFARRSVTRVAVRRQMREAMRRHGARLAAGQWALRLRAPLDVRLFRSATSAALVQAVRAELETLLQAAGQRSRPVAAVPQAR
jgi:ribonuclease P protein component